MALGVLGLVSAFSLGGLRAVGTPHPSHLRVVVALYRLLAFSQLRFSRSQSRGGGPTWLLKAGGLLSGGSSRPDSSAQKVVRC